MYKLLIADDEPWIRQGLLQIIDWRGCGIDEVWEAEDGGEALAKSLAFQPDIIITDVRMPDLDGLELCNRLRDRLPRTKVIIISGYQDFDYARRAVTLGVFDYIVKPLNEENIVATVQRCLGTIAQERQRQDELEAAKTQMRAHSSLRQQESLYRLLKEAVRDGAAALDSLRQLGLNMKAAAYRVFLAEISDFERLKRQLSLKEQDDMKLRLLKALQGWIDLHGVGLALPGENDRIYGCVGFPEAPPEAGLEREWQGWRAIPGHGPELSIRLYVSGRGTDLTQLPELREQAERCRERRFFAPQTALLFYDPAQDPPPAAAAAPYRYDAHSERGILEALRLGDRALLQQRLRQLAGELLEHHQSLTSQEALFIYEGLLEYVSRELAEEVPQAAGQFSADKLRTLKELKYQDHLDKAARCVESQFLEWLDRLRQLLGGEKRKIIRCVREYVEQRYPQKISLATAAEHFHFNPSYLSKLFCSETGESFTKYLMKIRIARAKEILKDPSVRIYEVGDRVGYSDLKYFTKVFKELEGLTPGEYRDRCLPHKLNSISK
ncbi:YesN/AraC family two-component response regulator [Hydrogenispora ethanolica]|uniref:YesN/AraC family two-component response regulator n=1 Tax=Hydrogenispora ethanolica TaxID=1082276 RepID=A0A4R1S7A4_HYDET|nr:response regulator transcription factor [Hydrogenispora ethanolica]TCL75119.1 YesN/AraC family two-component response regulator [Hydrogenispora ethanolica]